MEADTLDVTNLDAATVDYTDGDIMDGALTELVIGGITQFEKVEAGSGNDLVIVAKHGK